MKITTVLVALTFVHSFPCAAAASTVSISGKMYLDNKQPLEMSSSIINPYRMELTETNHGGDMEIRTIDKNGSVLNKVTVLCRFEHTTACEAGTKCGLRYLNYEDFDVVLPYDGRAKFIEIEKSGKSTKILLSGQLLEGIIQRIEPEHFLSSRKNPKNGSLEWNSLMTMVHQIQAKLNSPSPNEAIPLIADLEDKLGKTMDRKYRPSKYDMGHISYPDAIAVIEQTKSKIQADQN